MDRADDLLGRDGVSDAEHFDYMMRLYDAAGEALPAAAVVWRYLQPAELTALDVLSAQGVRLNPFPGEWLKLTAEQRARALLGMRAAVELGARCAYALELEARMRKAKR